MVLDVYCNAIQKQIMINTYISNWLIQMRNTDIALGMCIADECMHLISFLYVHVPANALHATNNFQIIPDFSLKDSMDQTVLGLALWTGTVHNSS